jgi:hypothetical protein
MISVGRLIYGHYAQLANKPVDEIKKKLEDSYTRAMERMASEMGKALAQFLATQDQFVYMAILKLMSTLYTYLSDYDEYLELAMRSLRAILYICGLAQRFASQVLLIPEEKISTEIFKKDYEYIIGRMKRKAWEAWLPKWAEQML